MSKLIGLCTIFALIYGEAVFADSQLIRAVESDDIDKVKSLKEQGIDINGRDDKGKTALMHAVEKGNLKIVKELSDFGYRRAFLQVKNGDLDIQDNDGWTALMYAVANENEKITDVLLCGVANANIQNE